MSIQSLLRSYEIALNAGDVENSLGLYGSEPVFMPQHEPALVGRTAVRAGYEQVFATNQPRA
jgi:ketosteroid isomerase-like protein